MNSFYRKVPGLTWLVAVVFVVSFAIPKLTWASVTLSNIQAVNITATSAQVTWSTDAQATSIVHYDSVSRQSVDLYTTHSGLHCDNGELVVSHCINLYNLQPATTYFYRVQSVGTDSVTYTSLQHTFTTLSGSGNTSTVANTIPPPDTQAPTTPQGLAISAGVNQVTLSWYPSSDNVSVAGYRVYRNGALVGTSNTTSFTDTGLTASTTYTYTLTAFDAAGNISGLGGGINVTTQSAPTNSSGGTTYTPAADTQPPSIPLGMFATTTSSSQIYITWRAATDNVGVSGYKVYKDSAPQTTTTNTSYLDTAVQAGNTYRYKVTALDAAGNTSGFSDEVSVSLPIQTPANANLAQLTGVTATASTYPGQVILHWTDTATNESSIRIFRRLANPTTQASWSLVGEAVGNSTSYADMNVPSGAVEYQVTACNSLGCGTPSAIASVTVPPSQSTNDTLSPSIPTGLQATSTSASQIYLSWQASTDNSGGSGVAGYQVLKNNLITATTSLTSFLQTGLLPGTSYYFAVTAFDYAGNVSPSSVPVLIQTTASSSPLSATTTQVSTLLGQVVDSANHLVKNSSVTIRQKDSLQQWEILSTDGTFSKMLQPGNFVIEASATDSSGARMFGSTEANLLPGDQKSLTVVMSSITPGQKSVTGSVLFTNGQPVTNALVEGYSENTKQWVTTVTDAAGKFSLLAAIGRFRVSVRPKENTAPLWVAPSIQQEVIFTNDASNETQTLNFTVRLPQATLTVIAQDAAGAVLAGAGITVAPEKAGTTVHTSSKSQFSKTNAQGEAVFSVYSGTFYVRASVPQSSGLVNPPETAIVIDTQTSEKLVLTFPQQETITKTSIHGLVKLEDGTAISNALVWAWSDQGAALQTTTDAAGNFSFQLAENVKWRIGSAKQINSFGYKSAETPVNFTYAHEPLFITLIALDPKPIPPSVTANAKPVTEAISVQSQDGAGVNVPSNAISAASAVNIQVTPSVAAPTQVGARVVGTAYDINVKDATGKSITQTQSEVEIVLPYDRNTLAKQGLTEDTITPSYYDETAGTWVQIDSFTVDKTRHVVIARVKHFTVFALVAPADTTRPEAPTNLTAWESSPAEITLSWVDPKADFHHAKVYRSESASDQGIVLNDTVTLSKLVDAGLSVGKTYYYSIKSVDAAGNESSTVRTIRVQVTGQVTVPSSAILGQNGSAHADGVLVRDGTTVYIIRDGQLAGFRNPAEYASYGFTFSQVVAANSADKQLPRDPVVVKAMPGSLVLDARDNKTVYIIGENATKRGFANADVFKALGYKFGKLLKINLSDYSQGQVIESSANPHPEGSLIQIQGAIWLIQNGVRRGFPTLAIFSSYGFTLARVVPGNAADTTLPLGDVLGFRDGTLVADGNSFYIISNGKKRGFVSLLALTVQGYRTKNAVRASLAQVPLGDPLE